MSQRGLKKEEGSNVKYLAMSNGQFVKRVKGPTPASKPRKLEKGPNEGNTIHEEHFGEFTGQLISIKVEKHEKFGASWAFKFDVTIEEPEFLILKLPYSSGYSNNILVRLPNIIDFKNDVTLRGYKFKPADKDKDIMGISISEWAGDAAVKVLPFYTKEEPNGIPEMKKVKVKGVEVWDDSDRLEFLEEMVNTMIVPKIGGAAMASGEEIAAAEFDENGDPLPF